MGSKIAIPKNGRSQVGPNDLRRAPPVPRLLRQLEGLKAKLADRQDTFAAWSESLSSESNLQPHFDRGDKQFEVLLDAFGPLSATLQALGKSGFSPPRKCFTANTAVGDHVTVLEAHRPSYEDILPIKQMSDLKVVKKYPGKGAGGKGGGLLAEASNGTTLKIAASHVVRLTKS